MRRYGNTRFDRYGGAFEKEGRAREKSLAARDVREQEQAWSEHEQFDGSRSAWVDSDPGATPHREPEKCFKHDNDKATCAQCRRNAETDYSHHAVPIEPSPACGAVCRNTRTGVVFTCLLNRDHLGDHLPPPAPSPEAMTAANAFFDSEESGGAVSHFARALDAFAAEREKVWTDNIPHMIRGAVEAEREACAKIAEGMAWAPDTGIARAIRARGGK